MHAHTVSWKQDAKRISNVLENVFLSSRTFLCVEFFPRKSSFEVAKKNYLEIKERRKNPSIPKINKININKNIDSPYLSNFTFYENCEKIVENGFSFGRTLNEIFTE